MSGLAAIDSYSLPPSEASRLGKQSFQIFMTRSLDEDESGMGFRGNAAPDVRILIHDDVSTPPLRPLANTSKYFVADDCSPSDFGIITKRASHSIGYALPKHILSQYQSLLQRRYEGTLSPDEEAELERMGSELDRADRESPLGVSILQRAEQQHSHWMATLKRVRLLLESLRGDD